MRNKIKNPWPPAGRQKLKNKQSLALRVEAPRAKSPRILRPGFGGAEIRRSENTSLHPSLAGVSRRRTKNGTSAYCLVPNAFTLIELLVVISIIGILTSLFLVSYANIQQKARNTQRKNDLKQYQTALENYSSVNNSLYPSKTDGSGASASTGLCPSLSGFMPGCPEDPRKNEDTNYSYLYQSDGSGTGATALKWTLWAKLEGETNFWVVCSDGRSGEKVQAGFSVSGGVCPL